MPVTLAPDDIVRTHADGGRERARAAARARAADRVPRRARSRGAGRSDRVADRRRALERDLRLSTGAGAASPAPRRRCRRAPTTCSARRGCSARSRRRPCARRGCSRCARTTDVIGAPFYVMERIDGERDHRLGARDARHARAARPDRRRADRRARRAARRRLGATSVSRASASRPAISSASCAASTACGSTTARASSPQVEEVGAWLQRTCPSRRRRRSSTATTGSGNTMFAAGSARAADRDLRLGDGDDRRPARRRRLHAHRTGPSPATTVGQVQPEQRDAPRPGFPTREELIGRYEERSGRSVRLPRLVRDARAVEGRRVHGGQLQAGARGHDRRPLPEDVR